MNEEAGNDDLHAKWRRHFEELEDGEEIDPARVLRDCDRVQRSRRTIVPDFAELPTLLELEHSFRANKRGKACFFDSIPPELAHVFPQHLARFFFPIMMKQSLLIAEPITLKGGILVQAYKGKGNMACCDSFRSLMVSSIFSKGVHRVLRRQAVPFLEEVRVPGQLGGLPGKAVSQAAHLLLAWSAYQRSLHRSTAVVFVDVRQAFYRLLRAHLTTPEHLDDDVIRLFGTLQLPPDSFQQFATEIEQARALQSSGMSAFMEAHLTEVLQNTWFALPGDSTLSRTRKGTRPGDNLADMLFSFVFAKLISRIVTSLEDDGVTFQYHGCDEAHPFPWQLEVQHQSTYTMMGPIWADDLAIMIDGDAPSELLHRTRLITARVFDFFALAGMDVNLGPSKTEVVVSLRGAGSPQIRRDLFRHQPPMLDVPTERLGTFHVRVVHNYKHLGTMYASGGRMVPEIRQRLGEAKAEFRLNRKKIYNQGKMTADRRIRLFRALIMSGLQYNAGIWPALTKQETTHFANGLLSLYSSLAFAIWGEATYQWRDEKILTKLGLPAPNDLLRMARLRHFQHLVLRADGHIWTMLHLENEWLRLLDSDLQWLREQAPWRVPQSDPRHEWAPWRAMICDGNKWKHLVQKAGFHSALQARRISEWYDWQRALLDQLALEGLWEDTFKERNTNYHACLKCKQRFNSKAAWSVHAFKIHQRVTQVRKVADGVQCHVCLKRYHSHDRLINHLKYSTKCYREHRRRLLFTATQPAANSAKVKRSNNSGSLPVLHAHGPQQPQQQEEFRVLDDIDKAERDTVEELMTLFEQLHTHPCSIEEAIQAVHNVFYNSCAYAPRLITVFCLTVDTYLDSGLANDQTHADFLKDLREAVYGLWSKEWLLSGMPQDVERSKTGRGDLEPDEEFVRLSNEGVHERIVRPLRLRQIVFLHLFSGHRRAGDVQQAVENLGTKMGHDTVALSVDIVISEQFGNLLNEKTYLVFEGALRAGWIAGVAAGPPCETWSVARERFYSDQCGPRPLRDAFHLSGYGVLRLKELLQVNIGNQLLGVALRLFLVAWLYGVFYVLEHPQEPESTTSASIWKIPCVRWMLGLPGVCRHLFFQGLFGAPSAKPTHLMFAHAGPDTARIFQGCQTTNRLPTTKSIGRSAGGQYLTARLKVYPAKFCEAIALTWWNQVRGRIDDTISFEAARDCVAFEAFQCAIQSIHSALGEEQEFGPDFHPVAARLQN